MKLDRKVFAEEIPEYGLKYWDDAIIMFELPFAFFAGFKTGCQNVAIFITERERDAWVEESVYREPLTEDQAWKRLNAEDNYIKSLCDYWWDEENNRIRWAAPA